MSRASRQLAAILQALPPPKRDAQFFSAAPIPNAPPHRVGKDADGNAVILIALNPSVFAGPRPPIELENLSIVHAIRCRVTDQESQSEDGLFTVVRCTAIDPTLRDQFLHVMSAVVRTLPPAPAPADVAQALDRVVELFRALLLPSDKSVQGLWAELFVLSVSSDCPALLRAWHSDPFETFDFSLGEQRIDVKSSHGPTRSHVFSLEQLRPANGVEAWIASVATDKSTGGVSVADLWDDVRAAIQDSPPLLLHLDHTVSASLGSGWKRASEESFDWARARESLAFFPVSSIPALAPVPSEITEVRFRVDLSGATATPVPELRSAGPLMAAAAPREARRQV